MKLDIQSGEGRVSCWAGALPRWGVQGASVRSLTCLTVVAAVLTTLSGFLGSTNSRKQMPRTAATASCTKTAA